VHCPFFPIQKNEIWWLIVADERMNLVMGLKRISSLRDKLEVKILFQAPRKPDIYTYTVFLVCDSYVGFDIKKSFKLNVKKEVEFKETHRDEDVDSEGEEIISEGEEDNNLEKQSEQEDVSGSDED